MVVIGLRVYGNTTHNVSPILVSIWDSINPKYWSVFGIDEIPKTGRKWNKYGIYKLFGVFRLRVIRNPTHSKSSSLFSIWDSIDPKYWSVIGIPLIPNTDLF